MMGTIASNLTKLAETKSAIKQAIQGRGVAVSDTDTFASYATKVKTLKNMIKCGGWTADMAKAADVPNWDVSDMDNMSHMFAYYQGTSLDLTKWDFTGCTTGNWGNVGMNYMFYAANLTSLDVSTWDVSMVRSMCGMFQYSKIKELDISMWDISSLVLARGWFSNMSKLTKLDMHGLDFSKVDMETLLTSDTALTWVDMSNTTWNGQFTAYWMFPGTGKVETLIGDHTLEEVQSGEVYIKNAFKTGGDALSKMSLNRASIVCVLMGLPTITTTQTLTLGSTLLAKLTDEDKKIATDKGWTLA